MDAKSFWPRKMEYIFEWGPILLIWVHLSEIMYLLWDWDGKNSLEWKRKKSQSLREIEMPENITFIKELRNALNKKTHYVNTNILEIYDTAIEVTLWFQ